MIPLLLFIAIAQPYGAGALDYSWAGKLDGSVAAYKVARMRRVTAGEHRFFLFSFSFPLPLSNCFQVQGCAHAKSGLTMTVNICIFTEGVVVDTIERQSKWKKKKGKIYKGM